MRLFFYRNQKGCGEMRKRWYRRVLIMSLILGCILGTGLCVSQLQEDLKRQQVSAGDVTNNFVIPGGMPIGIYMETDGVLVLGTDSITGMDGQKYSPSENLVKAGDYILAINGNEVVSKKELLREISNLESENVILKIRREKENIDIKIKAAVTNKYEYKLGIWVRDSIQGLGTITFLTQDNEFGALGHGIHDSDTEDLLEIKKGQVYETRVVNIQKGVKGTPGGMEGVIIYNRYNLLGTVEQNTECGVFGTINNVEALLEEEKAIPTCKKNEVKTGAATIRCCVTGEVKEYDIEIQKINRFSREENKGMVIKVVDEELLEITGGIIQGMSGSPIIQDGKLIGAVTHVLVNDPTRGYGIFIENMLEVAE